ncbi:MAG: glycogen/starch synthase [bacterium]|nr:glycogen/starch synthase [bacterium]
MKLFRKDEAPKVLFLTSEEFPFAKVGGLGEVMFSLPRALKKLGCDARVMMPRYGSIDKSVHKTSLVMEGLEVPTTPDLMGKHLRCNVLRFDATDDPNSPVTTYFLENQEYYELRSNVYEYTDDTIRFALLSRGCLEFLNLTREWVPDIIVTVDWMTSYTQSFLKTDYKDYDRLQRLTAILSIHNIHVQGPSRRFRFTPEMERDDGHGPIPDFFSPRLKHINAMRRGIMHADMVNTVSPTYAKELTTPEFGEGLDGLLKERGDRFLGILNGIDYEKNDPATDPLLPKNYSAKSLDDRTENKLALQERFGLEKDPNAFVIGIVSRLARQKGFALLQPIIEPLIKATNAQLFTVGTGDTEIMDFLRSFQDKYPKNVRTHLMYDDVLPHLVYGGADIVLIPSKFEPCGLIQMEAMRYGAIPVARRTGGLADSIVDYSPLEKRGIGFLFDEFDPTALLIAIIRAFESWNHRESWKKLQKRAMAADFSWDASAREYMKLFKKAMALKKPARSGAKPFTTSAA